MYILSKLLHYTINTILQLFLLLVQSISSVPLKFRELIKESNGEEVHLKLFTYKRDIVGTYGFRLKWIAFSLFTFTIINSTL